MPALTLGTVVSGEKGCGWISFQAEPEGREQTRLEFLLQPAAQGLFSLKEY